MYKYQPNDLIRKIINLELGFNQDVSVLYRKSLVKPMILWMFFIIEFVTLNPEWSSFHCWIYFEGNLLLQFYAQHIWKQVYI